MCDHRQYSSYFSHIALQLQKHPVELCLLTRPWLKSIQSVRIVVSITGAEGFPIVTCGLSPDAFAKHDRLCVANALRERRCNRRADGLGWGLRIAEV